MKYGIRGSMSLANALVRPDRFDPNNFEIALNGAIWYLKADDEGKRNQWVRYLNEQSNVFSNTPSFIKKNNDNEWARQIPNNVEVPLTTESVDGMDKLKKLAAHESNVSLKFFNLHNNIEELINFVIEQSKETNKQIPFVYNLKNELIDFKESLCLLSTMVEEISTTSTSSINGEKKDNEILNKKKVSEKEGGVNSIHNTSISLPSTMPIKETNISIQRPTINLPLQNPSSATLSVLSDDTEDEFFDTCPFTTSEGEENEGQLETGNINGSMILKDKENNVKIQLKMPEQSESHKILWETVNKITLEQLSAAKESVDEGKWELFTHSGPMKMYKMDVEIDGMICDPLKAYHYVNGVTAKEFLKYFYEFQYKKEWDDTLVKGILIEEVTPHLSIIHQIHKRIWPSAQRESLFWSHYRDVSEHKDEDCHDAFIVCNHDITREDVPLTSSSAVRVGLKIAMFCQTVILNKEIPIEQLTRNDIAVKIVYVAQVNPGGWLPKAPLMQVYKREYPKFLKQFTAYVEEKIKSKDIMI
uniref:START domain-containing protein n=1 Tax=Parastrongyloides trichosuri TaxID=131310 RepID=A0A0N4ZPR2_PARTI